MHGQVDIVDIRENVDIVDIRENIDYYVCIEW